MCGLGSITFGPEVTISEVKLDAAAAAMLKALDHRGGHACGMTVVLHDGQVGSQKAPVKALEFETERWKVPAATRAVAVHTRMATKGKPFWNQNNHPVTAGDGGVQLMHNGVVYDGHLDRRPGNPLVDTYALALAVDAVAKKKGSEGWLNYGERLVRACANISGSQCLQIAVRGYPVLVSAKVRTNPLFVCDVDDVRVTASTKAAVIDAIKALGLKVPTEKVEWETRRKGKVRKHVIDQELIYAAEDGDVYVWGGGEHTEGWIESFAPQVTKPAPQYGGGYSSSHPTSGATKVGTSSSPSTGPKERKGLMATPWPSGTDVKTGTGRKATVTGCEDNEHWRSYSVTIHADIDPLTLMPRAQASGKFSETILDRWWESDERSQAATQARYDAKIKALATPKAEVSSVKVTPIHRPKEDTIKEEVAALIADVKAGLPAKVSGMTGQGRDRRTNRAELEDFTETPSGIVVVKAEKPWSISLGAGRCEICNEEATHTFRVDDLVLCATCEYQVTTGAH